MRRRLLGTAIVVLLAIAGCGVQQVGEDAKLGRLRFMTQYQDTRLFSDPSENIPLVMTSSGAVYRLPGLSAGSTEGFAFLAPSGEWFAEFSDDYGEEFTGTGFVDLTSGTVHNVWNFHGALLAASRECEFGPYTVISTNSRFIATGSAPFSFKKDRPVVVYDRSAKRVTVIPLMQEVPCHRLLAVTDNGDVVIRSGSTISIRRSPDGRELRSLDAAKNISKLATDDLDWMEVRLIPESQRMVVLLKSKLAIVNLADFSLVSVTEIDPSVTLLDNRTLSEVGFDADSYGWVRIHQGKITLWVSDLSTGKVRKLWTERWSRKLLAVQVASPDFDTTIGSKALRKAVGS